MTRECYDCGACGCAPCPACPHTVCNAEPGGGECGACSCDHVAHVEGCAGMRPRDVAGYVDDAEADPLCLECAVERDSMNEQFTPTPLFERHQATGGAS